MSLTIKEVSRKYGIPENLVHLILNYLESEELEKYQLFLVNDSEEIKLNQAGIDYLILTTIKLNFDKEGSYELLKHAEEVVELKNKQLDLLYEEYLIAHRKLKVGPRTMESIISGGSDERTFRDKYFGLVDY
ncbi:hypothetical protein [Vagococcus fluvialis]|uniref:hypothetical protein n=1 Tax=Vagococcus fluvialis TaxID=2738 RepID=UPI0037BCF7CE